LARHCFDQLRAVTTPDYKTVWAGPEERTRRLGHHRARVVLRVDDEHATGPYGYVVDIGGAGAWDESIMDAGYALIGEGGKPITDNALSFRSGGPSGGRVRLVSERQDDTAEPGMRAADAGFALGV
jgi:hypothetical protein